MTGVTRERIIFLWGTVRESALAKGFSVNMGGKCVRVCVRVCVRACVCTCVCVCV